MTTVRQILRYARRLGQVPECGAKVFNQSVRFTSSQLQYKIIEDENGNKFFPSPSEFTPSRTFIHDYVWQHVKSYGNRPALVRIDKSSFFFLQRLAHVVSRTLFSARVMHRPKCYRVETYYLTQT